MMLDNYRPPATNDAVIRDGQRGEWLYFADPMDILIAKQHSEVIPCLQEVERLTQKRGVYAAGFISYEASSAFDPSYRTHSPSSFPLMWFGIYAQPHPVELAESQIYCDLGALEWEPSVCQHAYYKSIEKIKKHIEFGETYQVNYTIRQYARLQMKPWELFLQIGMTAPYGAFIETDYYTICSASLELFFRLNDHQITCRPMKGTAPRGCTTKEDLEIAQWLCHSEKNRAENVMIVDMVRNDLGRVALPGSIRTTELFETEKYPTLWQMTSTVTGKTHAPLTDVVKALFPCASITGAPKVKTMNFIAELEDKPRNIYTGCIGFIAPGDAAQFNVAIRTLLIDKSTCLAEYGVGGGILWDSIDANEYEECVIKTNILDDPRVHSSFSLLETILWTPEEGYFLLNHHLERLADSAAYFGYCCDTTYIRQELAALEGLFGMTKQKVRVLLQKHGDVACQHETLTDSIVTRPRRVRISPTPVDKNDPFLYHKTTNRSVYKSAMTVFSNVECDDVILWNEEGYITETCFANVVIRLSNRLVTPPVECGLLNGTYRSWLLGKKIIEEKMIPLCEISEETEIFLINSVRKWQKVCLEMPDSKLRGFLTQVG